MNKLLVLISISLLFLFSCNEQEPDFKAIIKAEEDPKPLIYLAENGVTVKAYDYANVWDRDTLNGETYTIIGNNTLREVIKFDKENPDIFTDYSKYVTTKVTNMNQLFHQFENFNGNIGNWDVSNVTGMRNIFIDCEFFDRDISHWDVSNVTTMYQAFYGAKSFNGDISNWDVSSVTDMQNMFYSAVKFNQDLSKWDVSNVTNHYRFDASATSWLDEYKPVFETVSE